MCNKNIYNEFEYIFNLIVISLQFAMSRLIEKPNLTMSIKSTTNSNSTSSTTASSTTIISSTAEDDPVSLKSTAATCKIVGEVETQPGTCVYDRIKQFS